MENIIISKEFLDWYEYYNECKEKYSSLVNDVEDKLICGEYKDIELPFSNMNTNNLNRDISSLEKIQVLMMQGSTSQINVEIELVKEKMFESCRNVNFGILCNPLASALYRMILDSSKTKKHIDDVSKQCKENAFYVSVCLRHFYASICEECIKGYSSYEFVQSVDSLIEEDKYSEACSLCPIYEEIYIQANKKGLLIKELIQVMHQYGVDVPVSKKKETKQLQVPASVKKKEILPKIVKKAVKALQTVIANGYRFTEPDSIAEARRDYQSANSTVISFYEECMCPWENGKIVRHCTTGRIYKVYQAWCRENNHGYARTAKEFREQLAGYLGGTFADVTTRQKGNTYYKDFTITEETKELYAKEYGYEETEFLAG